MTELLIQKLSAAFGTKSSLELGGDECDNLNFMNFKIDSFEIRKKNCEFLIFLQEILKFIKCEFAICGADGGLWAL